MSELGDLLKKVRTDKGISLDDLQETTKIRKRYLEAIEEGNYKVLPGNFYVRAFIKTYAEAVGLDPDEVLHMYKSVIPPTVPEPNIEPMRRKRRPPSSLDKLSKFASAVLMVAFLLLIVGLIYYYFVLHYQPKEPVADQAPITDKLPLNTDDASDGAIATPTPTAGWDEPVATPPAVSEEPVVTYIKTVSRIDYYEVENSDSVTIEVETIGDSCWMAIQKDNDSGEYVESNLTLHQGDSRSWTVDGSAYMNIGRGNAVEIKVNGKEINTGGSPNSKKFQIDLVKRDT